MYYEHAEVRAIEDYRTKQITIKGLLGVAPNGHTPIEYVVCVYRFGYWNRTNTRKVMREVKTELVKRAIDKGFVVRKVEMHDPWEWARA